MIMARQRLHFREARSLRRHGGVRPTAARTAGRTRGSSGGRSPRTPRARRRRRCRAARRSPGWGTARRRRAADGELAERDAPRVEVAYVEQVLAVLRVHDGVAVGGAGRELERAAHGHLPRRDAGLDVADDAGDAELVRAPAGHAAAVVQQPRLVAGLAVEPPDVVVAERRHAAAGRLPGR